MKLAKSIFLGSTSALLAVAGAQAADLPARKAAPVEYVKVCDAYGAGFFYIPGTDTCLKIGGRVRSDYTLSGRQSAYTSSFGGTAAGVAVANTVITRNPVTGAATASVNTFDPTPFGTNAPATNTQGWEARARVDLDARTQTPYGTVQTVVSLRLARTTGVLASPGTAPSATAAGLSSSAAVSTLEAGYIRFAGFTFGAARDNFAFMPSTFYGAGHWASFANGAKQLAYTAVMGSGLSATLALQDLSDTTAGYQTVGSYLTQNGVNFSSNTVTSSTLFGPQYVYKGMPQINGRLDWDQGWGSTSLVGAVGRANGVSANGDFNVSKTVWALGAGLKLNVPSLASGDVLWLNAAYANGMTEYTTNWTSFKSSDTRQNVGGFVTNHPSWINTFTGPGNGIPNGGRIETLKSWNVAAIFTHYWAPEWRHSFLGSYGQVDGTTSSKSLVFGQQGAFGDAKVWNLGTQLAWLPTRNFEIGIEALYARVSQDVRTVTPAGAAIINAQTGNANNAFNAGLTAAGGTVVNRVSNGNLTGRLRVERTF